MFYGPPRFPNFHVLAKRENRKNNTMVLHPVHILLVLPTNNIERTCVRALRYYPHNSPRLYYYYYYYYVIGIMR